MNGESFYEFQKERSTNLAIEKILNKTSLNPIQTKHLVPSPHIFKLKSTKAKRSSTSGLNPENVKQENNHFWINIQNHKYLNFNFNKNCVKKNANMIIKTPKKITLPHKKNYQLNLYGINNPDRDNVNKMKSKMNTQYFPFFSFSMSENKDQKGKHSLEGINDDRSDNNGLAGTKILNLSLKLNENLESINPSTSNHKRNTYMKLWENKLIEKNQNKSGKSRFFDFSKQDSNSIKHRSNFNFYNLCLNSKANITSYIGEKHHRVGPKEKFNITLGTSTNEKEAKPKSHNHKKSMLTNLLHKTQENMFLRGSNLKKNEIYLNTTNRSILRSYNGRNYKVRDSIYENFKHLHNKKFLINHPIIKLIEQNMGKMKIHDMIFGNSYINSLKGYNSACKESAIFQNSRVISPIHINYNSLEEIYSTK